MFLHLSDQSNVVVVLCSLLDYVISGSTQCIITMNDYPNRQTTTNKTSIHGKTGRVCLISAPHLHRIRCAIRDASFWYNKMFRTMLSYLAFLWYEKELTLCTDNCNWNYHRNCHWQIMTNCYQRKRLLWTDIGNGSRIQERNSSEDHHHYHHRYSSNVQPNDNGVSHL